MSGGASGSAIVGVPFSMLRSRLSASSVLSGRGPKMRHSCAPSSTSPMRFVAAASRNPSHFSGALLAVASSL
jgi:hypothetical protein